MSYFFIPPVITTLLLHVSISLTLLPWLGASAFCSAPMSLPEGGTSRAISVSAQDWHPQCNRDKERGQRWGAHWYSCFKSLMSVHQGDVPVLFDTKQNWSRWTRWKGWVLTGSLLNRSPFPPPSAQHQTHFFLLDFSERLVSDLVSPLSDLSERSALCGLSPRSDFSPRSDLLSALLPSRRVPSSVDEVVGWGWPHLAISSCSAMLLLMLVVQAFRSSCDSEREREMRESMGQDEW